MTDHNNCPEQFTFPARHLYAADTFKVAQEVADMDMVANTFMRAPGESDRHLRAGMRARRACRDDAARPGRAAAADRAGERPDVGPPFSSRNLVEAYRRGAERFGWDRRNRNPRAHREGEWLIGMGVATATYPYYRMPGGAARIRLPRTAARRFAWPPRDGHGHGDRPGAARRRAARPAARAGDVRVWRHVPAGGTMAGGSSQTASIVGGGHRGERGADQRAAQARRQRFAARRPQARRSRGARRRACASRRAGASRELRLDPAARGRGTSWSCEAQAPLPLETQKYSMHSYGAQFCEVRVNEVTGETRVSRFLGSFDCGRILNAKTGGKPVPRRHHHGPGPRAHRGDAVSTSASGGS